MAKNIFYISTSKRKAEPESISEISGKIVRLLTLLGDIDEVFLLPVFAREGMDEKEIDIAKLGFDESKKALINLFIYGFEGDIKKYDNVEYVDETFSRKLGFRFLLKFQPKGEQRFSLTGNLGSSEYPSIDLHYFYSKYEYDFNWYRSVLRAIVNFWNPEYAAVLVSLTSFLDLQRPLKIKHPFGWITYFSNDYELQIPDDLEGIEYEHTEKGKYLILTREDFTTDKETYEAHKQKLLEVMEEIKRRVPEYGK